MKIRDLIPNKPAGGLDPACCEAASKVTSWSDCDRLLGGGDSDGSTGIGCNKFFLKLCFESVFEALLLTSQDDPKWFPSFDPTNNNTIANTNSNAILLTCDTGSMPIRILLALSASFSQARAKSCSASTDVK